MKQNPKRLDHCLPSEGMTQGKEIQDYGTLYIVPGSNCVDVAEITMLNHSYTQPYAVLLFLLYV